MAIDQDNASNCRQCDTFFLKSNPRERYCSKACRYIARRARQRISERDCRAGRQAKKRRELQERHRYQVGDRVRFLEMQGEIMAVTEAGQFPKDGWRQCMLLNHGLVEGIPGGFSGVRAFTTKRYFIAVEMVGELRVFCPLLKSIKGRVKEDS